MAQLHFKDLEILKKKEFSFHTKKANRDRRCTAPFILSIGTRLRWVANFMPWIELQYPLNKCPGESQNWSGGFGEEKNLLLVPRFECQTIQPEASSVYYDTYKDVTHFKLYISFACMKRNCYVSFFHYAVACCKNSHTLNSIHFIVQKYICYPQFLEPKMQQNISSKPTVSMWISCYNYFPKHTWLIALYKINAKLDHRKGLLLHAMQN